MIPQRGDRALLWALPEGPHARLSLSSCKAGPAPSTLNLCLTPPGQEGQVFLLSLGRDGHTCALEEREASVVVEKFRWGKTSLRNVFAAVSLSVLITALYIYNRTSLVATVCICSFSKNFSPHLSEQSRVVQRNLEAFPLSSAGVLALSAAAE